MLIDPLTARHAGRVWRTSLAADLMLSPMVGEHYHDGCYTSVVCEGYPFAG